MGWGACCQSRRAGGPWSLEKTQHHINYLKLLAIFLATQTFAGKSNNLTILVQIDNKSAMTYVNKRGGTHSASLTQYSVVTVVMVYGEKDQPGSRTHTRSREHSGRRRVIEASRQMGLEAIFQQMNLIWGPLTLDFLASRTTTQLERFLIWRLDPLAAGTDAFYQQWMGRTFANPLWILIPRVLSEVRVQQATVILVAPVWKSQVWYPVLLS